MNKDKKNYTLLIMLLASYTVKFIFSDKYRNFAEILFLIVITITLIYFYNVYKKLYYNIGNFTITTFLILGAFPFCHFLIYNSDNNNYTFSQEYINLKKNEIKLELNNYKDCNELNKISKNLSPNLLSKKIDDSLMFKKIIYKDYYLKILPNNNIRRPTKRESRDKIIEFYTIKSKKLGTIYLTSGSLISGINEKNRQRNELIVLLNNPKKDIHFADLWLDSISGFVFSNIKPLTRLPQLIQLFQIFSLFIFAYMMTTFLDSSTNFKITKK